MKPVLVIGTANLCRAVPGAEWYEIQVLNASGAPIGGWVNVGNVLTRTVSAWLVGWTPDLDYILLVRAVNTALGAGPPSQSLNVHLIDSLAAPIVFIG